MDHAVINRRQDNARDREEQETGCDRIDAGKDLASIGLERRHRTHGREDHRRIEHAIEKPHALEAHIAGSADRQRNEDDEERDRGVASDPRSELCATRHRLMLVFEAKQIGHGACTPSCKGQSNR